MKIIELKVEDSEYIKQIIKIEQDIFAEEGALDIWGLIPIIRYGKVIILVDNNIVIGMAEYMQVFDKPELYLCGFGIQKQYRNLGYGKKLLEESIKTVKNRKIIKIGLTVNPENKTAINLYKKVGFIQKNLLKDEYGNGKDRFYFVKNL